MSAVSADQVLAFYQRAAVNMADLPLYNPALTVELVGWQPLRKRDGSPIQLGILITPWCMNVWVGGIDTEQLVGSNWALETAAGEFSLTLARDDGLGFYASGSLISMMGQFDSMTAARSYAEEVLTALLGGADAGSAQADAPLTPVPADSGKAPVMTRRGFLSAFRGAQDGANP